jgi:hypothetical protein
VSSRAIYVSDAVGTVFDTDVTNVVEETV